MIFAKKIAKLGKAKNINCNQVSANPLVFNIYLTNKNTAQKTLNFNNGQYSLSGQKNQHNYAEMCGLNETFVLARSDKYFSIIKVQ